MTFICQLECFAAALAQIFCVLLVFLSSSTSEKPMTKFYRMHTSRLVLTYKTFSGITETGCCGQCMLDNVCNSVNYQASSPSVCELSTLPLKDVDVNRQEASEWAVLSKTDPSDWILLFQALPDIGKDVLNSWVNGTDVTTDDVNCMTPDVTACPTHFRSDIVELWHTFGNFEVKLSMYKDGVEAAYIIFNGTGADMLEWFAPDRVLNSTWSGISDPVPDFFSIDEIPMRRFHILRVAAGCPHDEVVLLVLDGIAHSCAYDIHGSYPKLMYSPTNTWASFQAPAEYAFADSMMIAIRIL